jgi:hypothetical protein
MRPHIEPGVAQRALLVSEQQVVHNQPFTGRKGLHKIVNIEHEIANAQNNTVANIR